MNPGRPQTESGQGGGDEGAQDRQPGIEPAPTRRAFCSAALSGAGLLLATGALPGAYAQGSAGTLNLDRDPDLLRAYVKMRCSLGSEMSIGWLRGRRFAFSEGRVEPLCGMLAATFSSLNKASDHEFEFEVLEISFYTDLESGALLKSIKMPFTGEEVEVPTHRFGPVPLRFAVALDEVEHYRPAPGTNQSEFATEGSVAMTKSIARNYVHNGDLFLQHEEYGRRYPENSDRPSLFYRESTIWSAPWQEVADPSRPTVDSDVAYSALTSWRPWMNMGDIPGHTFSNGFGRRARSLADLPADYRAFLGQEHPDVLEDPHVILNGSGA